MPLFILKENGTEIFNNDRAIGTMVSSGIHPDLAINTVSTARELMTELEITHIPVDSWVILSEEIRRGNIAKATELLLNIPKPEHTKIESEEPGELIDLAVYSDEELLALTREVLARPERYDTFGLLQANVDYYISTISAGNRMLGYILALFSELMDHAILISGRAEQERILRAQMNAAEALELDLSNNQFANWKKRFLQMTNSFPKDSFNRKTAFFKKVYKSAIKSGHISINSLSEAIVHFDINVLGPIQGQEAPTSVPDLYASYRLTESQKQEINKRPHVKHPGGDFTPATRPKKPSDGDDPRDTPPPNVPGEIINGLAFMRWTTLEYPPFIKPDRHSIFCHKPIDKNGDRTKLIEFPGGYSLHRARPKAKQLQFITAQYDDRISKYWPPYPQKATLVPQAENTWVDSFMVKTSDTDDPNPTWEKLKEKLEEKLNEEDTKEKLQEKINEKLEDILGDVTVYGVKLGGALSGASKLLASAIIEFGNWILEEYFGAESFQTIVVTHKTQYINGDINSWLTWGTLDKDSEQAISFNPRIDDPNQGGSAVHRLSDYQAYIRDVGGMPGIFWKGESLIPNRLPGELNTIFTLRNAKYGEIYWPPNTRYGGHIFLPVKAKRSDSIYNLAVRTEVRAVWLQTW